MKLAARRRTVLCGAPTLQAGAPLWQRAPKRDEAGYPVTDFMMIAPGLKRRPTAEVEALIILIQGVLRRFEPWVVFADFNLGLNVLWVSHKHRPGLGWEIVGALRAVAPELRLVAHVPEIPK